MKLPICFFLTALMVTPGFAEEEVVLTGPQISALLPLITIEKDGATQIFLANGETLSKSRGAAGADKKGQWEVEEGKYVSTWPPSTTKQYYSVHRKGEELIFVATDGRRSVYNIRRRVGGSGAIPAAPPRVALTSKEMALLLPRIIMKNDRGATQTFESDGSTTYVYPGGSKSQGTWSIEEGKYWSKFGAGGKTGYSLYREGNQLIFVNSAGQPSNYTITDRPRD